MVKDATNLLFIDNRGKHGKFSPAVALCDVDAENPRQKLCPLQMRVSGGTRFSGIGCFGSRPRRLGIGHYEFAVS